VVGEQRREKSIVMSREERRAGDEREKGEWREKALLSSRLLLFYLSRLVYENRAEQTKGERREKSKAERVFFL
jgi:hypothetical protein